MVDEGESDVVFTEQVENRRKQPLFIADLDGEAGFGGQVFDKGFQAGKKFGATREGIAAEIRKLQQNDREFRTKPFCDPQEFVQDGFSVDQDSFVGDLPRSF